VRLRKKLIASILGLLCGASTLGSPSAIHAQDAVWRSSRPLRISAETTRPERYEVTREPRRTFYAGRSSVRATADRLQRLRAGLQLVRVEIDYLERRLESYDVFRFSDAMLRPIARTRLTLAAARTAAAEIETEIRRTAWGD
jgi:hypothetical protein